MSRIRYLGGAIGVHYVLRRVQQNPWHKINESPLTNLFEEIHKFYFFMLQLYY